MCFPALAAVVPALASAGGGLAGAGTFLGLNATAWTGIGLVGSIASTVGSAVGQAQQGRQQQAAYDYNARIQQQQALDAERRGSMEEGRQRQRAALIVGALNAEQGGSGLVAGADSGGDILAQTAEFGARDAAMARLNGARAAWGFRSGAQGDRYQGQLARSSVNAKAGSTFLSGVAGAVGKSPWWKSLQQDQEVEPGTLGRNWGDSRGYWGY